MLVVARSDQHGRQNWPQLGKLALRFSPQSGARRSLGLVRLVDGVKKMLAMIPQMRHPERTKAGRGMNPRPALWISPGYNGGFPARQYTADRPQDQPIAPTRCPYRRVSAYVNAGATGKPGGTGSRANRQQGPSGRTATRRDDRTPVGTRVSLCPRKPASG